MSLDFITDDFWIGVVAVGVAINIVGAIVYQSLVWLYRRRSDAAAARSQKREARVKAMVEDPKKLAAYRHDEVTSYLTAILFFVQAFGILASLRPSAPWLQFIYVVSLISLGIALYYQSEAFGIGSDIFAAELRLNIRAV